ncbi:hypothetical protein [Ramlibacter pinisoli]|uniref:hypothetical protein n=1 Tax=Ramlibacter pinisoli TaxID=2682844 RepID=UPI0015EF84F8|nr:hypothetical protein [Ramlibacter pinisoli]MBA2963100.1 hypothetical protein [Ramlibacter sp. CGMCC 1.13660]
MYYVIDGVRWGPQGGLTHVRWHSVDIPDDAIQHGNSRLVPVVDAAKVCGESEVRVFVDGPVGHSFRMKACREGIEAENPEQEQTLRDLLAHLPAV